MTAPEPTAVERTIAEVLRLHRPVSQPSQFEADRCITCDVPVMFMHQAQAVVAAIRDMPPEQMAELIGGEVGRRSEVASIVDNHRLSNGDLTTGLRLRRFARVVGPEVEVRDDL